jgi:LysM repeat protein
MHVGHVRQSNMVQGSELEVRWPLWARSGVVFACALVLLGGCANNSGSRAPVTDLNSSSSATARTYVIKAGDTVNKIARATGVDEATILRLNKNVNPNRLIIGQTLRLSEGSESAAAPARPGWGRSAVLQGRRPAWGPGGTAPHPPPPNLRS